MLDDPRSALWQGSDFSCLQNVQTSYWAHPDPYSMSISILSMVTESQRKLTKPSSSVKVQNKWSYTPLPFYAFMVQTRTSLALLIPLHEIKRPWSYVCGVHKICSCYCSYCLTAHCDTHITAHTVRLHVLYMSN